MLLFLLTIAMTGLFASGTSAAVNGWKESGSKVYYYSSGKTLKGYQKISGFHYYFSKQGVLKTGWVKTKEGIRYFRTDGELGKLGRQFTGIHKIESRKFGNDKKTGLLLTGFQEVDGKYYYFKPSGKTGSIGRAYYNCWVKIKKKKRYFGSDCVMVTNAWVKDTYYVGEDGTILKDTYTPDGYQVDKNGKKTGKKIGGWTKKKGKWYYYSLRKGEYLKKTWIKVNGNKYYVDKNGVRVTGFVTIGEYKYYLDPETGAVTTGVVTIKGKDYYFQSDGRLLIKGKENGFKTNSKGVITSRPHNRILIVAGHCTGSDSGAISSLGDETEYTRIFAKLIVNKLKSSGKVVVDYFLNGDISRSMYSLHKSYIYNNSVKVTGSGANAEKILSILRSHSDLVDLTKYDYVLEIHFNATAASNKDIGGNGSYKGLGFYMSSARVNSGDTQPERAVLTRVKNLGFSLWAGGIVTGDLYNMNICRELGVTYALLETAFIDDADDMTFFNNHRSEMAEAVADGILSVYG